MERYGLPFMPDLPAHGLAADDPHPRKTRRVEWVGEQSPMDDPRVAANLLMGRYTKVQEMAIRLAAARACTRVPGGRDRMFCHEHHDGIACVKGLSRTYYWHEGNGYICDVDYHDVDIILGSSAGHEFVDLDGLEPGQPKIKTFGPDVFKLIAVDTYRRDDERLHGGHQVAMTHPSDTLTVTPHRV